MIVAPKTEALTSIWRQRQNWWLDAYKTRLSYLRMTDLPERTETLGCILGLH
jgi:hypothetical protein